MPTSRDVNSVYGLDMSILDTPRSVSEITVEQLQSRNIESVTQLGQFSAGTYTPNRYGMASVPVIRGDLGELYQNGQRLRYNRNGYPVSFNAVEAVDVVKGPAPSVYGTGNQVGGYVNFLTKQAYWDTFHGEMSVQFGDLYLRPEGNPLRVEYNLDFGAPIIKDVLAYRVSYLGRNEEGYYQNTRNDTQDIFGTLDYKPYSNVHMQFTGQYYNDRYNEVIGANRVTQGLIDNGTYVTGTAPGGPSFMTVITPTGTTKIYPYQTLNGADDSARAQVGLGQLITTINVDDDFTIVNSTLGQYNEHRKLSHYEYIEYQPDAITFENRTEFRFNYDIPYGSDKPTPGVASKSSDGKDLKGIVAPESDGGEISNILNTGLTERYEHTKAYTEYYNEYIGGYDLTSNMSLTLPYANGGYPNGAAGGYVPIPGTSYYANSQYNTLESDLVQVGPFIEHIFKFNPQWSLLVGARADVNAAQSKDPLNPDVQDSLTAITHGYNASLTYKPVEWTTTYITYNHTQAYEGSYDSGGIGMNDGRIGIADFRKDSDLYEAGAKFDFFNKTLFAGVAGFYQTRNQNDRYGNANQIESRGVEVEMSYQPDKHFNLTSNFTWMEANYNNIASGEATLNYEDLYPAGYQIPGGGVGTGLGAPNFASGPKGDYRVPGVPNFLFNAYATYKFDCGFGFSIGPQVQGEQTANLSGSLKIPAQYTWNASIFYDQPRWMAKLDFVNFTDERNLSATDPGFAGNDLILYEQPFYMRASFKMRF